MTVRALRGPRLSDTAECYGGRRARIYHMVATNYEWRIDNKRGQLYRSARIGGVHFFFNPTLHLPTGEYQIEIQQGWPRFRKR